MSRTWYRIALAHAGGPPTVVVAPGEHLGAAIATAASRFDDAQPLAVAPATPGEVPLGESVGKGVVVDQGAAVELPATLLPWPSGVIPSLAVPAHKLAAIRPGWVRHADDNLLVIEAQLDGEALVEAFLGFIEKLPVADNLEVRVLDHHDGGGANEVWLTPRIDVKKAIRFLDDHDVELIENGHVELSLYLRQEKSTLRLTEHKTIVWLSEDRATEDRFTRLLEVPRVDALARLGDVAHFHYRPPGARTRDRMIARLRAMKLRKVG